MLTFFFAYTILAWNLPSFFANQCGKGVQSESGIALGGFIYDSFYSPSLWNCYETCVKTTVCLSVNYNLATKVCELNNATKEWRESGIQKRENSIYMTTPNAFTPGSRAFPAKSCSHLKSLVSKAPSGMYYLNPQDEGNHGNAFLAYCDMMSSGGGWTMCYTSNERVKMQTEVTYDPKFPYGSNGYRTNCNNLKFNEIMFTKEGSSSEHAYFRRRGGQALNVKDYDRTFATGNGLWDGHGVASASYPYQLLRCGDNQLVSGFFVSGYTNNCYKKCGHWCGDSSATYYRMAATRTYLGVAFKESAHRAVSNKLVSVGIREKE